MRIRKLLIHIVITFLLLVLFPHFSFAQTPSPMQGVSCGIAGDPNASACCDNAIDLTNISTSTSDLMNKMGLGIAAPIIDGIASAVSGGGQKVLEQTRLDQILKKCYLGDPDTSAGSCTCKIAPTPTGSPVVGSLCDTYTKGDELNACTDCKDKGGLLTGFGCLPLKFGDFISSFLLSRLIGFAGIMGILCIIYAAFTMQTSRANPEKIKRAQEIMTSCIMGLMLIIFSVFLLRLIGVDILQLPGFATK